MSGQQQPITQRQIIGGVSPFLTAAEDVWAEAIALTSSAALAVIAFAASWQTSQL
jgi:hypothetical protein